MARSRPTAAGWLIETGERSRATAFGWVIETQGGGAGNDSLTPIGITTGVVIVGVPSVTQVHALGAQSIVSGSPTLGQPSIPVDGNDDLIATGIETAPPVLGAPALTSGILGANIPSEGEHGGSPVPNDFTINPASLYSWEVVTPPTDGTLEIFTDLTFTWDAFGVADGDYTWVYRLYENGVSVGTATVYMHAGALAVVGIAAGNPVLGTPSITQNHVTTASGIVAGNPTLGTPSLTDVPAGTMVAENLAAAAPVLGTPAMSQNHALLGGAIAAGSPVFGTPTLAQQNAMMAIGVTSAAPTLGTPTLVSVAPVGSIIWPTESDVRLGVTYGPTGTEYTGTMAGGGGTYPTEESIASAVVAALQQTAIPANIKQVNDVTVQGAGTKLNPWQPV